jgi:hypothetical protein
MRGWKEMRPIVRRAVELTGGRAEFRDRHAPTWDGKSWHFARLRAEVHVVHEIAHWLALPQCRHLPNYGLGRDPDGGPRTPPEACLVIMPGLAKLVATKVGDEDYMTATEVAEMIRSTLSWEEEVATVLSIRLLVETGFSAWKGEANRTHLLNPANWWKLFFVKEILEERGVDFYDPLPGLRAAGAGERPRTSAA